MTDDNLLIEAQRKIDKLKNAFDMMLLCDVDPKVYRQIAVAVLCECDCVSCVTDDHNGCYYANGPCWKRTHMPLAPPESAGNYKGRLQ